MGSAAPDDALRDANETKDPDLGNPRPLRSVRAAGLAYEIRVKDHLETYWFEWFDGWTLTNLADGEVLLSGTGLDQSSTWGAQEPVELIPPHDPLDEAVATLLYRVSQAPYRKILEVIREWPEKKKEEALAVALIRRGPYDELIKEFRSGYSLIFDVLMDIGGWRDMHRHRRCQQ